MKTDSAFETLIEILSTPVLILLNEQESGVEVSNLLDKQGNPSIHCDRRFQ